LAEGRSAHRQFPAQQSNAFLSAAGSSLRTRSRASLEDAWKLDLHHLGPVGFVQTRAASKPEEEDLTMQAQHDITENQAVWLRMLESRDYERRTEIIAMPDEVLNVLVAKGYVRRWTDGNISITLGGIREVAQH
jgi:hypothetical protein